MTYRAPRYRLDKDPWRFPPDHWRAEAAGHFGDVFECVDVARPRLNDPFVGVGLGSALDTFELDFFGRHGEECDGAAKAIQGFWHGVGGFGVDGGAVEDEGSRLPYFISELVVGGLTLWDIGLEGRHEAGAV